MRYERDASNEDGGGCEAVYAGTNLANGWRRDSNFFSTYREMQCDKKVETVILMWQTESSGMMAVYDGLMKKNGGKLSKEPQIQARRRTTVLIDKKWRDRDVATAVGGALLPQS